MDFYVDEEKKYSATGNVPKESDTTLRIMMNLWTVTEKASSWAGYFRYQKKLEMAYDAVRFTRGEKVPHSRFLTMRAALIFIN